MMYAGMSLGGLLVAVVAAVYGVSIKGQTPHRRAINQYPNMPFEQVQWMSKDVDIHGWFIPSSLQEKGKFAPLIIIAHGWGSSRVCMLRYIEPLYQEATEELAVFPKHLR